jgi:hypothetical protein
VGLGEERGNIQRFHKTKSYMTWYYTVHIRTSYSVMELIRADLTFFETI